MKRATGEIIDWWIFKLGGIVPGILIATLPLWLSGCQMPLR
jgi:hypothetical protein